jgi:hypothetical protein
MYAVDPSTLQRRKLPRIGRNNSLFHGPAVGAAARFHGSEPWTGLRACA